MEVIKHFFSVPKVHFILGINGIALENSVKARYGAEIDAERYLRKFINVSFSLPRTLGERGEVEAVARYASHLISDMELPKRVSGRCLSILKCVAKSGDVSLRDVGKILSKIALLPNAVHETNYMEGYIDIICALLVTSVVDPRLHMK
ncbi:KAP family NTPase, partial [Rhodovulum sulfidophilum]|nr:KAP family NTPase [Rhodovulum sulfidophilum]